MKRLAAVIFSILVGASCGNDEIIFPSGVELSAGTWGGENAGLIVHGEGAHAHIGCTLGDISGAVPLDASGRFDVNGTYVLRAFPVMVGTSLPARYTGQVNGNRLEMTITVNDTVEHRTVVLGPVALRFGNEPNMGPCPICRVSLINGRKLP